MVRLSAAAEADIISMLAWTEDRFGHAACRRYQTLLITALRDVASDPGRLGSAARPELGPAVRSYHLRYSRERAGTLERIVRTPCHLLLYRTIVPGIIGVGRILHDAMELERHMPPDFGDL